MKSKKVFMIMDCNGKKYVDMIIGDSVNGMQTALTTKDYLEKRNDSEWIKYRIVELDLEGDIHTGKTNTISIVELNGIPCRAIANDYYKLFKISQEYKDNDYRKYTCYTEHIEM